ncbi:MAG: GNAT family N-acetyltransferase [Anaerolineaceae bacterium]|nr:GNAT family N-acetyltransferase [Anaerolineaceae bacterium]
MVIEPVTLEGQYVRLEPLSMDHYAGLSQFAMEEEVWRWFPSPLDTPEELRKFIELALKLQAEGSVLPFTTLYKPTNEVVGCSRFLSLDTHSHHVEIGATLVARAWQRSVINTEAKYLMLRHAFETWGCLRVEFKTDSLNTKSRNALARIGATQEGIFRNHIICANGRVRHSVYFSITDEEWPRVKADLEEKLARPFTPPS